ncbi:MAG: polyribonucleotide nucleotidyltransferase [Candidatus Staskawiczbacteria bacterium RIFCSPHIGHO2_02_FULL_43_16]|uniref:Polyribonucleotide nucleotidyltransferase n=1 Tax=Candidatus Staskawiczbacteria bacterium RIFCSPHIGHO2_01_FULL_41_41 TaxID=1802203 RepID=A0A1G2HVA6_9BACT|nr:MAG: polyribonucleotide nucleotidyltransferase [Candidatus Staskawiczbacteria bacterium RIFCSPHIGHO2_01_FULL_41_41]OGZ68929.1 MAG: polyribonucleotide nucleotidyltransferase [Candidatus Staskawiczbacteria bacterium RIFCSPHIGHO2_02_FULL_43_16]OGZ74889.1 MAG: polyribonucleotide nucleotidyltransferase [Candidatus Staskawiczbacteria bacterium RIFCSPLOWO2_01_FULL_43_17b]
MQKDVFELEIGGRLMKIKITDWASQASGSCLISYGDTELIATATVSNKDVSGQDFFPLSVDYEEKFYAAGKIYGSRFLKRESRPTDDAILTSRMIDRAVRPLFPKDFKKEVQVITTCLSWDGENDPDLFGMIGASFALASSPIPWNGPLAAVRVGKVGGNFIINPTYAQRAEGSMDLTLAALERDGKVLINMVEMGAKEVMEEDVVAAMEFAGKTLHQIIEFQKDIVKKIGKEKVVFEAAVHLDVQKDIEDLLGNRLEQAITGAPKGEKNMDGVDALKKECVDMVKEKYPDQGKEKQVLYFFEKETEKILIHNILEKNQRPDGRTPEEIRPLWCEVAVLPRTHGSGVFHRGLTKILSILTLGGPGDQQILEGMEIVGKKRFMHHYNFPPFSTGETGFMRGPKRREIGHGHLAEKALLPLIPDPKDFPYTIRIVSEALSSNGSTSMASVCAASIALMDAGVPIKEPVAGISIGLAKNEETGKYKVLTDIQGPEDHFGDMDFKVAGTKNGITAIQMDVKIDGINMDIVKEALQKAKDARFKILDIIKQGIAEPRKNLSVYAPKMLSLQINPAKIGEVVGPKGSVINKLIEEFGVTIDIEDSGLVFITGDKQEGVDGAADKIRSIAREIVIGEVFQGTVRKIMEFGAFVDILPGQSGLVHISKFVPGKINSVKDVVKEGDIIPVKVVEIDAMGRLNLSAIDAGFKPKK